MKDHLKDLIYATPSVRVHVVKVSSALVAWDGGLGMRLRRRFGLVLCGCGCVHAYKHACVQAFVCVNIHVVCVCFGEEGTKARRLK